MAGTAGRIDRVLSAVDAAADQIVGFTSDLIRVTVNPPGSGHADCARWRCRSLELTGTERA